MDVIGKPSPQPDGSLLTQLKAIERLSQTALEHLALQCLPERKEHPLEQALAEEALLQQTLLQRSEHLNTLLQAQTTPLNALATALTREELIAWKQFIHQHEQLGLLIKQRHHYLAHQLEQVQQQQTQLRKYHSQATLY